MTNSKHVPKRRFKEFELDDEWEQLKLGDHANILTGGTPNTSISSYWEPKEIPWMSSGEVNRKRLDKTDNMISNDGIRNSSARWVKKHSILIALAGQGKTRGMVAVNNIPLTTNQSVAAIEPDKTLNYEFVFQNLSKRYDELRLISSGDGSRGGLNKQIVSDISIACPNVNEQELIGNFSADFDSLITMSQHKLDKLKNLKKAYLSEMFPTEGERVPKRRFPGFEGEWECRKLKKLAEFRRGSFPQPYGKAEWYGGSGSMPFVQVVDVLSNLKLAETTKQQISRLAQNQSVLVPKDSVVVTLQGSIGRVAITQYDAYVDRTLLIFEKFLLPIDGYYWALSIQKLFDIESKKAPGGTIKTITKEALSEFEVLVPVIDEQKKIGNFFKKLDQSITLQQQKLDKLNDLKKAYLNELFV